MKNMLIAVILLSFAPGTAKAATTYETCVKEEKILKARETDDCSGLKYLLNPSGCFATRKKVREFASGTCGEIIRAGKLEMPTAPAAPAVPEKKIIVPPATVPAAKPVIEPERPVAAATKAAPAPQISPPTLEQLKEENASLKAEIRRLKLENEKLRNR